MKKSILSIKDLAYAIKVGDVGLIADCKGQGLSLNDPMTEASTTRSPFSYALAEENWKSAHVLIDLGIRLDQLSGTFKWNALGPCIIHYEKSVFDRLLDLGVDVNHADTEKETPLYYAVRHFESGGKDPYVVKQLLERGADWTVEDKMGVNIESLLRAEPKLELVLEAEIARREAMELNKETPQPVKVPGYRSRL